MQKGFRDNMQTTQPFRKCHLQILRSLYDGQDGDASHDRKSDAGQLLGGGGRGGADESVTNDNAEANRLNGAEGDAADDANDSEAEGPVVGEIWDLIERFLQQRMEYRPHKERQIHWAKVNDEAQNRLDHLESLSTVEEDKKMPMIRSSSLTPRTPLFAASGRAGSMQSQSMSLTPQSSNRNAPKLSEGEREMVSTVPAWNFISQMLQRRSRLCTDSCQSFRSQPFLAQLRNEAETRCKILESVLKCLKKGTGKQQQNGNKREKSSMNPAGKRQKLGMEGTQPTIPSSLGHFFSEKYSELAQSDLDEIHYDEESIMETQMKLCLWSSLLSSVREIVDEIKE